MFKTIFNVILSLLLSTATSDLIGYNRLGNNVRYHVQSMSMRNLFAPVDYRIQYHKWIRENNIFISDDNKWIQNLPTVNHRVKPSRKNLVDNIEHVVLTQVVESYHSNFN